MKKTGKSGCGHLKKMEKKSRELTVGRAILETQAELRRSEEQKPAQSGISRIPCAPAWIREQFA